MVLGMKSETCQPCCENAPDCILGMSSNTLSAPSCHTLRSTLVNSWVHQRVSKTKAQKKYPSDTQTYTRPHQWKWYSGMKSAHKRGGTWSSLIYYLIWQPSRDIISSRQEYIFFRVIIVGKRILEFLVFSLPSAEIFLSPQFNKKETVKSNFWTFLYRGKMLCGIITEGVIVLDSI